ncbi:MAG TPA: DMT family transporter [Rhabdochlamydiaceae bacterium]
MASDFFKGICFVLSACLIWGLIFVVPQFMEGFSSIEIATGRYFFYGIISLCLFFKAKLQNFSLHAWTKSLLYSLIYAVAYYPCVILGLRYATPPICALIMGIGPITIALYGNWREKECSYRSLLLPSFLILIGLAIINGPAFLGSETPSTYLLGLLTCFIALVTFSWYVVVNARFLKDNREISSSGWSTLNGVTTLFWVILFVLGTGLFFKESLDIGKYLIYTPQLGGFLAGCAILGVFCSWLGIFLWNKATLYLPVSFAGQLTIFETIFGLLFIYLLEQRLPTLLECIGIALFLIAIGEGIRQSSKLNPSHPS